MSPAPVRGELVSLPLVESVRLSEVVRSSACGIGPALCKPAFCPDGSGRFVCGTEDQDPARRTRNLLLLAALDSGSRLVRESVTSYPVVEHLRDLHWYDAEHVVFALNDKIGLLRVGADNEIVESVVFPSFHKDTIRELAVAPFQPGLIISGGFDGNVFVTDIERLVTDIRRQQRRSENSLYPCGDVVGSVAWHPTQARVASCTTDGGILHIFDTRTELRSPALMFDAHRSELYTHAYVSDVMVALGFGSGLLQLVDWRMRRALALYRDPLLRAVGDIRVGGNGTAAVFGMSCVTVYESLQPSAAVTRGYGGAAAGDAQYRCNGNFRPGTGLLAVTDSLGCLQIYDAGATLDPA